VHSTSWRLRDFDAGAARADLVDEPRRCVSKYADYYNETRTHLSLAKDAPEPRRVQRTSEGGLHHEYRRRAA
jgi:hypothetical protein